ncbi:MAG: hypothetical protein V3U71_02125 [Cocleimonas sp.]
MKSPIIVVGIGEIGSVLARGFLRTGFPVYPVTRDMDMEQIADSVDEPEAVVVAVGESGLHEVLENVPANWRSKLILIQNELLPNDWQQHDLDPTVISVWFEKKKGQDVKVVVPSPIHGKSAAILSNALNALDIPNEIITDAEQMTFELVRKNYYILTSNIAGLKTGGTVGDLWQEHKDFAELVITDVNAIQEHLLEIKLDKEALIQAMLVAFDGDPDHGCKGRSAPARLERAIDIAEKAGLSVPTLIKINQL